MEKGNHFDRGVMGINCSNPSTAIRWFICLTAFGLGIMLMFSGTQHLKNPFVFLGSIVRYNLLPHWGASIVAVVLPSLEIAIGVMLTQHTVRSKAFLMAAGLFACFSLVQFYALVVGLKIGCGCFGPAFDKQVSIASVLTVLSFFVLALVGCALSWNWTGYLD